MMPHGWFVVGTDTGVGKTTVSSGMVRGFAQRGYRSAGMKPVASGATIQHGILQSEDVAALQRAANVELPQSWVNPYVFEPPVAPHIAAAQAGITIDFERIQCCAQEMAHHVDTLVIEGVGGFRVPLGPQGDTADLAVRLGLPVVLVVGLKLGCLNHALLTVEAIISRKLELAGWVANMLPPQMAEVEQNIAMLQQLIPAPLLAVMPCQTGVDEVVFEDGGWLQKLLT